MDASGMLPSWSSPCCRRKPGFIVRRLGDSNTARYVSKFSLATKSFTMASGRCSPSRSSTMATKWAKSSKPSSSAACAVPVILEQGWRLASTLPTSHQFLENGREFGQGFLVSDGFCILIEGFSERSSSSTCLSSSTSSAGSSSRSSTTGASRISATFSSTAAFRITMISRSSECPKRSA